MVSDAFNYYIGYPYAGQIAAATGDKDTAFARRVNCALMNIAIEILWQSLISRPDGVLVDVACGEAWASYIFSLFMQVVAVDTNPDCINAINTNIGKGITPIRAGGDSIPLEDNSVDIVFTCSGFHHMPDRLAALNEWHRILKTGGMLVAIGEVPQEDEETLRDLLEHFEKDGIDCEDGYTIAELEVLFDKCMFTDIKYIRMKYCENMEFMSRSELEVPYLPLENGENGLIVAIK